VDRALDADEAVYGPATQIGHGSDTRLSEEEIRPIATQEQPATGARESHRYATGSAAQWQGIQAIRDEHRVIFVAAAGSDEPPTLQRRDAVGELVTPGYVGLPVRP